MIPSRLLTSECLQAALEKPPRGAGIAVIGHPWADRVLARAHPAFPVAFFVPVAMLLVAFAHRPGTLVRDIVAFLVGGLVWTLAEYALHRFVFHKEFPPTRDGKIAAFLVHGYHHAYPRDPTRLVLPPMASIPIALALFVVTHVVLGGGAMDTGLAGFIAGYVAYDTLHYVSHHTRRTKGMIGWLRRYHTLHHHDGVAARFGVSSPLWDFVFRTYRDPRAPRRA